MQVHRYLVNNHFVCLLSRAQHPFPNALIQRGYESPILDLLSAQTGSGRHDPESQATAANVSDADPKLADLGPGACTFWRSAIISIENVNRSMINTRKHEVHRENNWQHVTK
jgi:hypothetical protein